MRCPKCGQESSGNYCSNCGTPLTGRSGRLPERFYGPEDDGREDEFIEDVYGVGDDTEGERPDFPTVPAEELLKEEPQSGPISLKKWKEEYAALSGHSNREGAEEDGTYGDQVRRSRKAEAGEKTARPGRKKERKNGRSVNAREAKREKREQQQKEARMKKLESEVEQLRSRRDFGAGGQDGKTAGRSRAARAMTRKEREQEGAYDGRRPTAVRAFPGQWDTEARNRERLSEGPESRRSEDGGISPGEAAVKGVAAVAVITSRLMQLASFLLMAAMTLVMAQSFWEHGQALGDIRLVAATHNYGLALYAGFAGAALVSGAVWSLWILSRKGAGGGVRMKKYDTGRGFLPFLLCMAVIVLAAFLPSQIPGEAESWKGMEKGVLAVLEAVNSQRGLLLSCSGAGAVLSLVRKLLRV